MRDIPLSILMVDDDPDDIFLTRTVCNRSSASINFIGLNSGEALFDYINNNSLDSIDLILLDVFMPARNGYDVRKMLHSYNGINNVTIVMLSSFERNYENHAKIACGDAAFIKKPANTEEMSRFVDMLTLYHANYKASPRTFFS